MKIFISYNKAAGKAYVSTSVPEETWYYDNFEFVSLWEAFTFLYKAGFENPTEPDLHLPLHSQEEKELYWFLWRFFLGLEELYIDSDNGISGGPIGISFNSQLWEKYTNGVLEPLFKHLEEVLL